MVKIKGLGTFDTVPQVVIDIMNEDIPALNSRLSKRWNIDRRIEIGACLHSPIGIALMTEAMASITWLVEHGVNLNEKYNHSFAIAVRYCDENIIRYLVENGAEVIPAFPFGGKYGTDAFVEALNGDKLNNLSLIHSLGHTVEQYGGNAFLDVIMENNKQAIDFFIENGVDINHIGGGSIFRDSKFTPLCVAARFADIEMCKILVDNGADVTIAGKDNLRPYTIALERGDFEMANYFKSLEAPQFHNLQNKLLELKPYKLPNALLDFLQGDNLRLDFGKKATHRGCEYIDFFSITDVVPIKIGRTKMLRLSREVENYHGSVEIVWNPKEKMIAGYDVEHEELDNIATFEDFINNACEHMKKFLR